jgi:hypothetical protein
VTALTEFLLARIAEDEAGAREAQALANIYTDPQWHWLVAHNDGSRWQQTSHDPARVLAECEAKRRIVQTMQTAEDQAWQDGEARPVIEYIAARTLRTLALPYADHPNYREEWRP